MAKAYASKVNKELRDVAREVKDKHFPGSGSQTAMAKALGVSPGFISEFLRGGRGAGLELLCGLGRFSPLKVAKILGLDPRKIAKEVSGVEDNGEEERLSRLPEELQRAARAAIELYGATRAEAVLAAELIYKEIGDMPLFSAEDWLNRLRGELPKRKKSGVVRRAGSSDLAPTPKGRKIDEEK